MLLVMFVSGQSLAALQIPARQIVLAQKSAEPVITVSRAESTPLLAPSLLLPQDRESFVARTSLRFPGPYERDHGLPADGGINRRLLTTMGLGNRR